MEAEANAMEGLYEKFRVKIKWCIYKDGFKWHIYQEDFKLGLRFLFIFLFISIYLSEINVILLHWVSFNHFKNI